MFTVERRVGRVVEVVIADPFTVDEVHAMIQAVRLEAIASAEKFVLCAVLKRVKLFHPDASEPLLQMLRRDNGRLLRAGYLLGSRYGTFALQIDRLVREAGNADRRWFHRDDELQQWLSEVLTRDEARRVSELVAEHA